jgi:hypothetical protein
MRLRHLPLALVLLAFLAAPGCRNQKAAASAPVSSRTEELASGRIGVTLTATPATANLEHPLFLTFTVTAPEAVTVEWPPLDDRFEGFDLAGAYEMQAHTENGRTTREFRIRLNPRAASEYRLKPLAVTYRDSGGPGGWIKTRAVTFKADPIPPVTAMRPPAPPLAIPPSPREIGRWIVILLAAAGLGLLLFKLIRRMIRQIQLRQMSPRQRALLELDELVSRQLVEHGHLKDFYFELTAVVRRYIERSHGIRAPEQTTEEFLLSAGADPRFPKESLGNLKAFLMAADWVKFADFRPGPEAVPEALQTARNYVTTDPVDPGKEGG